MLLVLVSSTVNMYEIMACFITGSQHFPEMLLYDKQSKNDSDLNDNNKI